MRAIALDPRQVPAALRGTYSGRKFEAIVTESVTVPADAGLWSGGSRDIYSAYRFTNGAVDAVKLPYQDGSPWDGTRRERTLPLTPDMIVVCHSIFCGKDAGLTFYVHPANAAKLLPAPAAELSANERTVLKATRGYKSSYMGRDRYDMAKDDATWKDRSTPFMTRAEWDTVKAGLIGKGLLNKAGAITVAGRNAILAE